MRRISRSGRPGFRLAAILAGAGLIVALSGCGVIAKEFSDGEYAETIPAALRESDLGVTEAFASKGLDGFTFYLAVGVDIDHETLSHDELGSILQIIVDGNDLPTENLVLYATNIDDELINLDDMVRAIAPGVDVGSVGSEARITTDEAREIIDAVNTGQP